jgi:hypothetical protein
MDIKNMMGVANVLAIFSELSADAKGEIISELRKEGQISNMNWQDVTKSKPPTHTPVYIKSGVRNEPNTKMAMWDGEKWFYIDIYNELEHVSYYCLTN